MNYGNYTIEGKINEKLKNEKNQDMTKDRSWLRRED